MAVTSGDWEPLPLDDWRETLDTLHLWSQVVGKVRLALTPIVSHWWNCTFQPTPRGLTTGIMYHGRTPVEIAFDFVDHRLLIDAGAARAVVRLVPRSVADFHEEVLGRLRDLRVPVRVNPLPNEVVDPVPFPDDQVHAAYDAAAVESFHGALLTAHRLLTLHRAAFLGKSSPVHFFWGSFDLAVTRFSGRRAPTHPGGIPHLPDWVTREAYSHECASAGWWPGNGGFGRAAFYAYAYPEPAGYRHAAPLPEGARYSEELREFVLTWDDARSAPDPDAAVLAFLEATWSAAADGGGWERAALERSAPEGARLEALLRAADRPLDGGPEAATG